MRTGTYPLSIEQKQIIIDSIEDVGLENLNMALVRVLCNSDCLRLTAEERDTVYKFLHGMSLVINEPIEALVTS